MANPRALTKAMLKSRKPQRICGNGEAWYYIDWRGIEVCVANEKGQTASNAILITKRQLKRALEIMNG